MGRRNRKSKRKVNSLLTMVVLTAILMVTSTYAWFSANREVSITGITAKVKAAEGLQISLDGETWGSTVVASKSALTALATANKNTMQFPDELIPVSTDGTITSGDMNFWYGDVSADGSYLDNVVAVSATSGGKYIAFDCYFKNASSQTTDPFQFNAGTNVALTTGQSNAEDNGVADTGLENSVRAGLVLYDSTAPLSALGSAVRALTAGTSPKAVIWEPNYNVHIAEVVTNDARIQAANSAFNTLTLTSASVQTKFEDIDVAAAADNTDLGTPTTMQTAAALTAVQRLVAVDGTTQLSLVGNAISKTRIYIWLEGQDPDCNDTASTGNSVSFVLNFTKPAVVSGGSGGGSGG